MSALQRAIQYGPYNGLYDGDCSGTLYNDDLNKFLANYGNNLNGGFVIGSGSPLDGSGAAGAGAAGAGAEEMPVDDGTEPDLAELASWLEVRLAHRVLHFEFCIRAARITSTYCTPPQKGLSCARHT